MTKTLIPAVWFFDHGIHVFPVAGKEPAVPRGTSQFDYRCSRAEAARMRDYGVPLGLFAVADSDSPETEAWVAAHLPETPFKVTTGRGRHRYYRLVVDAPHFIHRGGHTIEFRHRGQYVVGPGSVHASGAVYTADDWSWNIRDVPFFPVTDFLFDDRSPEARGSADGEPLVLPEAVSAGERHETLHKIMRSLVAHGVPLDGALKTCYAENRAKCRPPLPEDNTLDAFLRRAYHQKDRADFVRSPKTEGWLLAGSLLETGLSIDAILVAVRSIDPAFDPETSA
jgi:hypothetical protein